MKSVSVRSSDVQFDGGLNLVVNSGLVAFGIGASSNLGAVVAPCDLTVKSAKLYIGTSPTSANAKVNFGTVADSDAYLNAYSCNGLAAGEYDLIAATEWVTKSIPKGTLMVFELEAATAVGNAALTLVLVPTSQVA